MLSFFSESKNIRAVMSVASDGPMERVANKNENILEAPNRFRFFLKNGIDSQRTVSLELKAGSVAGVLLEVPPNGVYSEADGLVTKLPGVFLTATAADCALVFLWEEKAGIVGICHAGWRGVAQGIIKNTIKKILVIRGELSSVRAVISPALGVCCFEIKEDVASIFNNLGFSLFIKKKKGRLFLDLKGIIKKQLENSGLKSENITISSDCTFCDPKYFSYRQSGDNINKGPISLMIGAIGIV